MICFIFCKESTRSIGHRFGTLSTHIPIDQKNHSNYNANLERFYYTLKIFADHWVSSDNIESMEESCLGAKIVHSISIEKHVWVSKGVDPQDFNNIIMQNVIRFIPFK